MTLESQWQIVKIIEDFVGSVDAFREEVYALEGDPFPEWWAKKNIELANELTSIHEFAHALRLVRKLGFRFERNAKLIAQLSLETYPHVPEMVSIELFLSALSSGSAVELYTMHDKPCGPTWQALAALTDARQFSSRRVHTDCYYVGAAENVVDAHNQDESRSSRDYGRGSLAPRAVQRRSSLRAGPALDARVL